MHAHLAETFEYQSRIAKQYNIWYVIAMCFIYKYIYKYINTENDEEH